MKLSIELSATCDSWINMNSIDTWFAENICVWAWTGFEPIRAALYVDTTLFIYHCESAFKIDIPEYTICTIFCLINSPWDRLT